MTPFSLEAKRLLERWAPRARALLDELLEDAASDVQRELLMRALVAGHSPAELHAFADEIRALSDEEAFEACTLAHAAPADYTVTQLLRAEGDPLFAFESKGGTIEPAEDELDLSAPAPAARTVEMPRAAPIVLPRPAVKPPPAPPASRPGTRPAASSGRGFDAVSQPALPRVKGGFDVEEKTNVSWGAGSETSLSGVGPAPSSARFLEDLLQESTRAFSLNWKESDIDVGSGLRLADAVAGAAMALGKGIPVPCVVGATAGNYRRLVLMLQISTSGKSRAWQLYDPFSKELVWANEGDLLAGKELPFADKALRRLTRIALPVSSRFGG